jgi:RNA polymerase sigma-70 factor (ECF subfamily)
MERLPNEQELIVAMQAGSEQAFTELYRHFSPRLYMNIHAMVRDNGLAEELVQELFTRIWQKRDSPGISENFTGYMYRIAQNLVYDLFRKLQRDRKLQEIFKLGAGDHYEIPVEQKLYQQQLSALLQRAIEQLPRQQKRAYQLVRLEGHTYKMAAAEMGVSPLTIKEYLTAANKSIRTQIEGLTGNAAPYILLWVVFFELSLR